MEALLYTLAPIIGAGYSAPLIEEVRVMCRYKYTIVVEQDEDGIYIASCPALQGCYTQGDTYEEAIANIKVAVSNKNDECRSNA